MPAPFSPSNWAGRGSIEFVLEAVAMPCPENGACWRPVPVEGGFASVSADVALVWAVLFILFLVLLVRRLRQG